MSLNVYLWGFKSDAKGSELKNIELSSTHTRLPTHLACYRVLFCKGQLPGGKWSAEDLTVRHPQRSHMHCTQLQNNPSLPRGSSCNTSTTCTYKGKGSSHHTVMGRWDVPPGAHLSVHISASTTSPVHREEGSTAEGIRDSTACKLPGGKWGIGITSESQRSRFLGKSI